MNDITIIVLLTIAISYTVEISGAMQDLSKLVYRKIFGSDYPYNGWVIPILGCGKCATFWAVLIFSFTAYSVIEAFIVASIASFASIIVTKTLSFILYVYGLILDKLIDKARNDKRKGNKTHSK